MPIHMEFDSSYEGRNFDTAQGKQIGFPFWSGPIVFLGVVLDLKIEHVEYNVIM